MFVTTTRGLIFARGALADAIEALQEAHDLVDEQICYRQEGDPAGPVDISKLIDTAADRIADAEEGIAQK